jgi:hypothetical protein
MSFVIAENYQAIGSVDLISVKVLDTIIMQQELSAIGS